MISSTQQARIVTSLAIRWKINLILIFFFLPFIINVVQNFKLFKNVKVLKDNSNFFFILKFQELLNLILKDYSNYFEQDDIKWQIFHARVLLADLS